MGQCLKSLVEVKIVAPGISWEKWKPRHQTNSIGPNITHSSRIIRVHATRETGQLVKGLDERHLCLSTIASRSWDILEVNKNR